MPAGKAAFLLLGNAVGNKSGLLGRTRQDALGCIAAGVVALDYGGIKESRWMRS
jgi:hypothetical protein